MCFLKRTWASLIFKLPYTQLFILQVGEGLGTRLHTTIIYLKLISFLAVGILVCILTITNFCFPRNPVHDPGVCVGYVVPVEFGVLDTAPEVFHFLCIPLCTFMYAWNKINAWWFYPFLLLVIYAKSIVVYRQYSSEAEKCICEGSTIPSQP